MKTWMKGALAGLLAVPALAMAQGNTNSAPDMSCFDIRFSLDFLDRYPMAPAICQTVVEKDGIKYARMSARVTSKTDGAVMVGFKNVAGTVLSELELKPQPGSTVTINGKSVKWSDVKVGDTLNFYLPERALSIVDQPGDGVQTPIIFRSR
jgi:hypothetical protein